MKYKYFIELGKERFFAKEGDYVTDVSGDVVISYCFNSFFAPKEIKPENIWNEKKREDVKDAIDNYKSLLTPKESEQQKVIVKDLQKKFIREDLEKARNALLMNSHYLGLEDVTKIFTAETKKELEEIYLRMGDNKILSNIGAPNQTKEQEEVIDNYNKIVGHSTRHKADVNIRCSKDFLEKAIDKLKENSDKNQNTVFQGNYLDEVLENCTLLQEKHIERCFPDNDIITAKTFEFSPKGDPLKSFTDACKEAKKVPLTPEEVFKVSELRNVRNSADEAFRLFETGKKETEGKLYYELSWEFIEEMAKRMANNKSGKYELYNWRKNIETEDLKQAINRHHIEVMKGNYKDNEEILGHIVSYATNAMMLWEQLNKEK